MPCSSSQVAKDDQVPATKEDVQLLKGDVRHLREETATRFGAVDHQFTILLNLLDQKLDREYFDAKLEEMDQRWYNTFTNQGVVLNQHDKRLKAVERRVGIAA